MFRTCTKGEYNIIASLGWLIHTKASLREGSSAVGSLCYTFHYGMMCCSEISCCYRREHPHQSIQLVTCIVSLRGASTHLCPHGLQCPIITEEWYKAVSSIPYNVVLLLMMIRVIFLRFLVVELILGNIVCVFVCDLYVFSLDSNTWHMSTSITFLLLFGGAVVCWQI